MIYLTGASGFLGRYILKELNRINCKVCCISRNPMKNILIDNWLQYDIDIHSNNEILFKEDSIIIHAAGVLKGSNEYLNRLNYLSTKKILDLAEKQRINRFIYVSSIDVLLLNSPYAISKKKAEDIVKASNVNWVIIRPSVIFGKDDNKNFYTLNKFVKLIVNLQFVL